MEQAQQHIKEALRDKAPKEITERQNWMHHKFIFLKMHIRCKSEVQGAIASDTNSREISMLSDTTIQPSVTSPSHASTCYLVNQQVMDQMRTMPSSFLDQDRGQLEQPYATT